MKNYLQKLLIVLLALSFVLFTSCDDDEEGEVGGRADLIGTWSFVDFTFEFLVDGEDFIQWSIDNLGLTEEEAEELEALFNEDFESPEGTVTFNDDDTYTATSPGEEDETGSWSKNGETLTIDPDGDSPTTFEILKLNNSTLVIGYTESDSDDFDEDGTSENLEFNTTLTLEK